MRRFFTTLLSPRSLGGIALAFITLRLGVLSVRAFLPLGYPDIWRQADTLGVALRYWLRWTEESGGGGWLNLLPATLNSGEHRGIGPMEFPALNLLAAPFFGFGPELGRSLAVLWVTLLAFLIALWNARRWRGQRLDGVDAHTAMLLLPVFSIPLLWSGKFMPDFISIALVCAACAARESRRWVGPAVLAAIGLLMKPVSVIVLGVLFLKERHQWRGAWRWALPALAVAGIYYTAGMVGLRALRDGGDHFWVEAREPLAALGGFLRDPGALGELVNFRFFLPFGVWLVALFAWRARAAWLVLAAQTLGVGVLAGHHTYDHPYYFIGVAPVCAVLFTRAWVGARAPAFRAVMLLLWLVPVLEACAMDFKPWLKPGTLQHWGADADCAALHVRHPEFPWHRGYAFRSPGEDYPMLGLCFGERESAVGTRYGFGWDDNPLPAGCRAADHSGRLVLWECG